MVIQIQSKWLSLVLILGKSENGPPPPPPPPHNGEPTKLPTGSEEARRPLIIGLVK